MHDVALPEISDEQMKERLAATREYSLVILHTTTDTFAPESAPIIWEHGRRNMALRQAGTLSVVCPATDRGDIAGICLFAASPLEARELMAGDPAIRAGVLTYELLGVRGFPGDALP